MCAESADQVQVDAVRPVPPTEFFRVGLADGPAAVRALKERLRHIQGRGLSPVRTLAPSGVRLVNQSLRWWMEPPVERGEACPAHAEGHRADRVSVFLPSVAAEEADGSASRSHGVEYRILASVVSIASLPKKRPSSARALGAFTFGALSPCSPRRNTDRRASCGEDTFGSCTTRESRG